MKREEIRRRRAFGKRRAARDLPRFGNQLEARTRKYRCVQHLADRASCLGSLVLVEKRRARGDIQQHQAAQKGQCSLGEPSAGFEFQMHTDT